VSDRALKRLVARLGGARDEDVEAVLKELGPGQRKQIRDMLRGAPPPPRKSAPPPADAPDSGEGLSLWLRTRLRAASGAASAEASPRFTMTETAARALIAAAAEPQTRARPAPLARPSRIEQMKGRLIRPRVTT